MEQQFVWEKIKQEVLRNLSVLTGAEGRFDYMVSAKEKVIAIVDYAHTPGCIVKCAGNDKKIKKRI